LEAEKKAKEQERLAKIAM